MSAVAILLLTLQIVVSQSYYFRVDWDPGTVRSAVTAFVKQGNLDNFHSYFSRYPNNLFLVWLFSLLVRLYGRYFITVIFQCCICQLSGLFLLSIVLTRYENLRMGLMAYFYIYVLQGYRRG